jgi:hypothetical protein
MRLVSIVCLQDRMLLVDPGVVHQHIDPAELIDDPLDERPHLLRVGKVGLQRQMATARECGNSVVGCLLSNAKLDNERGTARRELLGHGSTDSPGAARDQHHHAFEAHLHRVPGLKHHCRRPANGEGRVGGPGGGRRRR